MNIYINNKQTETKALSLAELAEELNLPERGVAMAVGTRMVQRAQWGTTTLSEGDSIIIIKAACGG
ncbi:MAG: sulfur carrier protein ThiS [Prevotella sp.]|nr:sulfur carrier protein ThiS [Prevotella sp.]MDE7457107.1 sulfur carrier protein ThiS [Prevotella sp.]